MDNFKNSILIASTNANKVKEYKDIFDLYGFSAKPLKITKDVEETGSTYKDNAILKLKSALNEYTNNDSIIIAEDSGFEIEGLNKFPGLMSHRFFSMFKRDPKEDPNILLTELAKLALASYTDKADYHCCIAVYFPKNKKIETFDGEVLGTIVLPTGKSGFAYDPIFKCSDTNKTFAESPESKKVFSQRADAVRKMMAYLK
jgi:XTP/dITP diphosphohydrolase